jgi:hypothetical protein
MRRLLILIVIAVAVFCLGCGEDQTSRDDIKPTPPVWVERAADNVYPQQGIRAEPVSDERSHRVRLDWYANPEPDVSGYRIWRLGEWTDPLYRYLVTDLRLGPDLEPGLGRYTCVDQGDSMGVETDLLRPDPDTGASRGYFWYLQAYDSTGNFSALSAPAYYRLINNPTSVSVARDSENMYVLSWDWAPNPDVVVSYYMIRVYSRMWGPDSAIWHQQVFRYGTSESVYMDFSGLTVPLVTDCTYTCQLNVLSNRPTPEHADALAGASVFTIFPYQN